MSVTLLLRLTHPVRLDEVERAASSALQELLNLDRSPVVSASFDESDREGVQSNGLLTESSNRVLFSVSGYNEKIAVTPMTVPVQVDGADGSYSFTDQAYLSVAWHYKKSPLCWALIGAVALGIARSLTSEIEDNAGFFTGINIQGAGEFSGSLRLSTRHADLEAAAEAFYSKMPKSAEIAEWLERQPT